MKDPRREYYSWLTIFVPIGTRLRASTNTETGTSRQLMAYERKAENTDKEMIINKKRNAEGDQESVHTCENHELHVYCGIAYTVNHRAPSST